ncbi:MAG: hypothetical protein KDD40_01215 [Bdellovibrionales bacterium]|nr:hypothetical protein [Bdellovibrionales bacterium]
MKAQYRIFIIAFALLMSACAPMESHEPSQADNQKENLQDPVIQRARPRTGYSTYLKTQATPEKVQEVIYTPSGDLSTFKKVAEEERASPYHSPTFSQSFVAVYIQQNIQKDDIREFDIKIEMENLKELLQFKYSIPEQNKFTKVNTSNTTKTNDGYSYELVTVCENDDCSLLVLTLKKLKDNKNFEQMSGMFTVKTKDYHIEVAKEESSAKNATQKMNKTLDALTNNHQVVVETIAIVDGPSKQKLKVTDSKQSQNVIFATELPVADTQQEQIGAITGAKLTTLAQGDVTQVALAGNNPQKGKQIVEIQVPQGKARLFIGERTTESKKPTLKPQKNFLPMYKNSILPVITSGFTPAELKESVEVTSRLEAYREHENTKKYIDFFLSKKPAANTIGACSMNTNYNWHKAKAFLTQMNSKVPQINITLGELTAKILNKVDAPIQTAYLIALESPYMTNGFNADIITKYQKEAGYSDSQLQQIGKRRWEFWSDAAGPYQCLTDTCRYIIRKNKSLLQKAGLDPKVFYVTPLERDMYNKTLASGVEEHEIKRGNFRQSIFDQSLESQYALERESASLHPEDARKYFATATLLAGLVINESLIEKKLYQKEPNNLPKNLEFVKKLRQDPSLAYYAYYAGTEVMAKSAICSQLTDKTERANCKKSISRNEISSRRHEGFDTTLAEITEYNMADCKYLNYTWAWLALQFIGSNPQLYNFELGSPDVEGLTLEGLLPPTDMDLLTFLNDTNAENS